MLATLRRHNQCLLFKRVGTRTEDFLEWQLEPKPKLSTVPRGEGLWLIRAAHPAEAQDRKRYYLGLRTPERICDELFILAKDDLEQAELAAFEGVLIPMLACEDYGPEQQYYAREHPEVGIEILRKGLVTAKHKAAIAENLAAILAKEERYEEAIQRISVAIEEYERGSPAELVKQRAEWKARVGDQRGADEDLKWLRRTGQKQMQARRSEFAKQLRESPSTANLSRYLEAGFALPKDPRLLTTLIGVSDSEELLLPVLKSIDELVREGGFSNPRLLSQKLETLRLRLDEGDVSELARAIRTSLER